MIEKMWRFLAGSVLISLVSGSWIDPDTPSSAFSTISNVDSAKLDLVFSDEFEITGRTFDDGHDPRWTALNKNDYTNDALQFYDKDHVSTSGGYLNITTTAEHTYFSAYDEKTHKLSRQKKNFKSGMIQGWNKFCFTGGVVEIQAKLPGSAYIGGLWPAIWIMGNLARATYVGSSDWMWPWSYDHCDRSIQKKQRVSKCDPYPHFDFHSHEGRGAPEIDILEAMPGHAKMPPSNIEKPYFSTSLQIAPGIDGPNRPNKGGYPAKGTWYEGMEYGPNTSMNLYFFGSRTSKANPEYSYQADALSGNTQLNENLWEGFRRFKIEWKLPSNANANTEKKGADNQEEGTGAGVDELHKDGYVKWYFDDKLVYGVSGNTLSKKLGAMIPSEPSYVIINTAMSATWGFPEGEAGCPDHCDCSCYDCLDPSGKCTCGFAPGFCSSIPAHFLIDYVRVYQNPADKSQKVGCSTPERPTSKWIKGHAYAYKEDTDIAPLLPQEVGGGRCHSDSECGGSESKHNKRGKCSSGHCKCMSENFVGPYCKSHTGSDPYQWEQTEALGFAPPVLPDALVSALVVLVVMAASTYFVYLRKLQSTSRKTGSDSASNVLSDSRLAFSLAPDAVGSSPRSLQRNQRDVSTESLTQVERKAYSLVRGPSEVMLNRMVDR